MNKRLTAIRSILRDEFPEATTSLDYDSPFQLLVATILSAQCTDERVNIVTKELFAAYPDAQSMARADIDDIKRLIFSTGFYNNKAKNIQEMSRMLLDKFDGVIPNDIEILTKLPGVARKTANVVLGSAYGLAQGVVVDTHVQRISKRLGLTKEKSPDKIERDLMRILPKSDWIWFAHSLVLFGRSTCKAKKPLCATCPLNNICPSAFKC